MLELTVRLSRHVKTDQKSLDGYSCTHRNGNCQDSHVPNTVDNSSTRIAGVEETDGILPEKPFKSK